MKIRLTEAQLKRIIKESINELNVFANNVPEAIRPKFLKKVASEHPELDPNGFFWMGGALKHNGKKAVKTQAPKVKRQITPKPDNMSDEEYFETIVIPQNEKVRAESEKFPDEEWRPLVNGGRYFGGEADYSKSYAISNHGRLRVLNYGNPNKSRIVNPYPAETRNAMQFNLMGAGNDGTNLHTCPNVAYMVANAFLGEQDPKLYLVRHIDGDWRNNNVDNLEWVPRSRKSR